MKKNPLLASPEREPRALLKLLRSEAGQFSRNVAAGIDTPAQSLGITRRFPEQGSPFCFVVINRDPGAALSPCHFRLHERDVEFHELWPPEALDTSLSREIAGKIESARFGLVVVLGVVNGPNASRGTAKVSWWERTKRFFSESGPTSTERRLRSYREAILEVSATAASLRRQLPRSSAVPVPIIEAIHDWGRRVTHWDISGAAEKFRKG